MKGSTRNQRCAGPYWPALVVFSAVISLGSLASAATISGHRVFLQENESVAQDGLNLPDDAQFYGANGNESLSIRTLGQLTLDGNIETLLLPESFSHYTLTTTGTRITIRDETGQLQIMGLNKPMTVEFSDLVAVLSLDALNQLSVETTGGFTVSGTVSGLSGTLVLTNNGEDSLTVTQNGPFSFNNALKSGSVYNVSVESAPVNQVCSVTNGKGQLLDQSISDISVLCTSSTVSVTLTGVISTQVGTDVDSDINDPQATPNTSNDSAAVAQEISNFVTLSGFASREGSFGTTNNGNDRFAFTADVADVFHATLQAGQEIRLQVVDFSGTDLFQGDLDLYLYDKDLNLVEFSNSTDEFEDVVVPADGEYFIQVAAFSGISKYILQLNAPGTENQAAGIPEFVIGEAIVQFRPNAMPSGVISQGPGTLDRYQITALTSAGIQTTHHATDRPTLAHWSQASGIVQASAGSPMARELRARNPRSFEKVQTLETIKQLSLRADVEYAEPNYIRQAKLVPNDRYYSLQWHYPAINLPQAWEITTGTPQNGEVIVAVIDTGVYLDHSDLQGQLVAGYDFISDPDNARDGDGIDANPDDPGDSAQLNSSSWHGTHVAGTIAAASNNGTGVTGVAWDAKIMPLRALGQYGGTDYDINQAMRFAAQLSNDSGTIPAQKADIINMSLGGGGYSRSSQQTINSVRNAGVIIIAAAGNESSSQLSYPASYDGVVSVSATDYEGNLAPYSNFGTRVDVAAPGGNTSVDLNQDGYADGVLSTIVDDSQGTRKSTLSFYQGTSMATPHVAGVAALMKALYPELSPTDFDTLLAAGEITNDAGSAGRDNSYGHGIIDALKAVQAAEKLAQGGANTVLPALIVASPSSLSLGTGSSATLTLSNQGGESAAITGISDSASWLTVTPESTDSSGLGDYLVQVDRTGLASSSYTGTITFSLSTGETLKVQVSMVVGDASSSANPGKLYILLLDTNRDTVQQVTPVALGDGLFSYTFNGVSPGTYTIAAGSDVDNDGFICTLGETCGGYPLISNMSRLDVTNLNLENLDFVAEVLANFGIASQSQSGNPVPGKGFARPMEGNALKQTP